MSRRAAAALAALAAVGATVAAVTLGAGGERADRLGPAPTRAFAATSFWNAPLARDAPLDPRSPLLSAELLRQVREYTPWINTTDHSTPVYTVAARQRRVSVHLDTPSALYTSPAGAGIVARQLTSVPIPDTARGAAGVNHHIVIWQPATDTVWELWNAHRVPRDPCPWHNERIRGWHAAWGARIASASRSPGINPFPAGATASGLPLLGGLIRLVDWRSGRIDHALAMAIPDIQRGRFVWPATRTDGRYGGPNAIPMGTRLRLDPAADVDSLPMAPAGKAIARAAQRYGIVVRDHADRALVFYGEDPAPTGANPYPAIFSGLSPDRVLRGFPWNRLQVLAVPAP
jgi:hypothetical protein